MAPNANKERSRLNQPQHIDHQRYAFFQTKLQFAEVPCVYLFTIFSLANFYL